tara:strand:+ start:1339 stop:3276 length:1938 start_codon:yes stop_codon:yes gene_type:complete
MAEKVISPGVFTNEIDQSFLPAAIGEIGGALIGPTVKGPALQPVVVSSYAEFQERFGDIFKSGSTTDLHGAGAKSLTYLTSMAARNYLKHANKLTVVRIMDGAFKHATAWIPTGSGDLHTGSSHAKYTAGSPTSKTHIPSQTDSAASFKLHTHSHGSLLNNGGMKEAVTVPVLASTVSATGSAGILNSGSKHNIRWEITSNNTKKGTFTLLIRRGDDITKRKQILETWNNLSLDPNATNYIARIIGDSAMTLRGTSDDPFLQMSGSYPNKSKYVRVEVLKQTPDYLDENGSVRDNAQSQSLPGESSGSFGGAFFGGDDGYTGFDAVGNAKGAASASAGQPNMYENIGTQTQGYIPQTAGAQGREAYTKALSLLSNQDEYDINLLMVPGILNSVHPAITQKAIDVCEDRGDTFVVIDPVAWGTSNIVSVTDESEKHDSNYAAMYWPWVQVPEPELGRNVWVPPSTVIPGIYAFNDKVAHPWFAPAGLNRGGIDTAIQAERKLTQKNRDDLYDANMNPIATFPGQGVCVWGQKTLQKKPSALDRVNVRRLLIALKKFIASTSRFLVFEQNNPKTRNRFLNIVNPYLEQVQSNSGLSAFKVVMDDSNNPPDTVDRNILYGQIFVQPTRTAEFIVLDFTVQNTGATFPE